MIDLDDEPERLLRDPSFYFQDVDGAAGAAILVPMTRATYAQSSFLDHRTISAEPRKYSVPLEQLLELYRSDTPAPRKACYIFHGALCGSTLLARCLGGLPNCFALKEPYALHYLARRKLDNDPKFSTYFSLAIALTSRTFEPQEIPIIKTSDLCNGIIGDVLGVHADSRAIFMYASLEDFIVQVLKSDEGRTWARRRGDLMSRSSIVPRIRGCSMTTDVQSAAAIWLDAVYRHIDHCQRQPSQLVPSLEFRRYLANMLGATLSVLRHFEIDASPQLLAEQIVLQSRSHSKRPSEAYGTDVALRRLDEGRAKFRSETEEGIEWALTITGSDSLPTVPQPIVLE